MSEGRAGEETVLQYEFPRYGSLKLRVTDPDVRPVERVGARVLETACQFRLDRKAGAFLWWPTYTP